MYNFTLNFILKWDHKQYACTKKIFTYNNLKDKI